MPYNTGHGGFCFGRSVEELDFHPCEDSSSQALRVEEFKWYENVKICTEANELFVIGTVLFPSLSYPSSYDAPYSVCFSSRSSETTA
jgi:hypothetical protein